MRGFTITEILIAACIFLVLVLSLFQSLDISRSLWFNDEVSVELRREIIKTFTNMERELKETRPALTNLASGTSSATLTFCVPQDNDGDETILNSFGDIEWSPQITYALNDSHQITRTVSGNTTIVANNVSDLLFTRPLSPVNIIQVDITASKNSAFGRQIQDAGQITVEMRN
ncbi:MAG: hypothetical protein PHT31_03535 [Candidatus Omnitrophica bacterium]|nr:hypothetical protein [Candidatus Omnitrophota bacterium]MDD5653217.1 hypothetical protein [Candidatus Omnitrophota bacterium]